MKVSIIAVYLHYPIPLGLVQNDCADSTLEDGMLSR